MLKVRNLVLANGKCVSFEIQRGELVLLRGPNGSGKSLLLKSLARLIPAKWDELSWDGKNAEDFDSSQWRSRLLYVAPEVSFSQEFTVAEYLQEPFKLSHYQGFEPSFDPGPYVQDPTIPMTRLSSGQRQFMALLRAMTLKAEGLLLDESFVHMDRSTRELSFSLLENWKKTQKFLLVVSHFELGIGDGAFKDLTIEG